MLSEGFVLSPSFDGRLAQIGDPMRTHSIPAGIVPDEALRRFASSESDELVSVLIELDLPEPKVSLETRSMPLSGPRWRPTAVAAETQEEKEEAVRRKAEADRHLGTVLGKTPHWLPYAHAYAAEISPQQLRQVVETPYVLRVSPNGTFRDPAGKG
jgi:hypothetical protein